MKGTIQKYVFNYFSGSLPLKNLWKTVRTVFFLEYLFSCGSSRVLDQVVPHYSVVTMGAAFDDQKYPEFSSSKPSFD